MYMQIVNGRIIGIILKKAINMLRLLKRKKKCKDIQYYSHEYNM